MNCVEEADSLNVELLNSYYVLYPLLLFLVVIKRFMLRGLESKPVLAVPSAGCV
jgi:hypothetical protein